MKKLLAILLVLVLAFSLVACGDTAEDNTSDDSSDSGNSTSTDAVKVAVIPQYPPEEWAQSILNGAKRACEYYGFEYHDFDCNADLATQISIIEDCITQGYTAIIFQACDGTSEDVVVDEGKDAGVIMIDFDCLITINSEEKSNTDGSVKSDDTLGGATACDLLCDAIGGEGTILILQENPGVGSGVYRNNGFRAELEAKYPNVTLIQNRPQDTSRAGCQTWVQDYLISNPEIVGVFCYFGDAAIGAYNGIMEAGRTDIKLVGYDATAEQSEFMKADGASCVEIASIALAPDLMGGGCVDLVNLILEGKYEKADESEINWLGNGLLTPDNAATYEEVKWEEPYFTA